MKRARLFALLCVILAANSAYLYVTDHLAFPTRTLVEASLYVAMVMLHLVIGVVVVGGLFRLCRKLLAAGPQIGTGSTTLAILMAVSLCFVAATGVYLVIVGNHHAQHPFLLMHNGSAGCLVLFSLLYLFVRWRKTTGDLRPASWMVRLAAISVLAIGVPMAGGLAYIQWGTVKERGVTNPPTAPPEMKYEGGGQWSAFWPSSAQSVDQVFFPAPYFMDSSSCGKAGCHQAIYKEWESSAHHLSSFNNQWYRKSIEYLQEVKGTRPSKWCGGCHDMSILLTKQAHANKSLMDIPIVKQDWPPHDYPKAHAGIGCAVCHTIVHVKSTMGNGDYLADYPPMHRFVDAKNPALRSIYDWLQKVAPRPHDKTFLKPFHTENTPQFCSVCHKVHLDVPVNSYRWFRGFDDYDSWQGSGVSGQGAQSFYYPATPEGQPDFKTCADCHMPLTKAQDPSRPSGFVHSHRFAAANTALPFVNHDRVQLATVTKFLEDKQISVDLFALRRPIGPPKAAAGQHKIAAAAAQESTPQAANLMENSGPIALSSNMTATPEDVIAPINRGAVAVRRGETVLIDAVVRTRKVGHLFPAGTNDAFDVWLQLDAWDNKGQKIFSSGDLEYPNGPVDKWAHFYRAYLIDEHGNVINKRNASSARYRVYAHVIPPGADDTVHYELRVPANCGDQIRLTCKLNYRKFSWWNNAWSYAGRPIMPGDPNYAKDGRLTGEGVGLHGSKLVTVNYDDRKWVFDASTTRVSGQIKAIPNLPIVTMATNTVTLKVVDGDPHRATEPRKLNPDRKVDMLRWNDYGIGFLLQGDSLRATAAFQKAASILPKSPEPLVNLGRIRLLEGNLDEAKGYFEKALKLYDAKPTPMTPYQKARTLNFYAQVLKAQGQYDQAMVILDQVIQVFPEDKQVRDLRGRIYFLQHDFPKALEEYQRSVAIDPEDVNANYNLMLVYRGLGDEAHSTQREQLYLRFKADELNDRLGGPFKRTHPWDNIESESIHTHTNHPGGK